MFNVRDTRYEDVKLTFKEEGHSYTDSLGNSYLSATTLLHRYSPVFDKDYWLRKKAKELHISEKRLAEQWGTITKEACERGTKTHNGLEDGIKGSSMFKEAVKYMMKPNGEMVTVADIPDIHANVKEMSLPEFIELTENKYPKFYKVFEYYTSNGYKIYSEIGAFLIDYLISGTIDVLLLREDQFVIGDWKTNRGGLKFESGYYKKDKSTLPAQETDVWVPTNETLLPPVSNLPKCNGMIYNLQLSLYATMVEYILGIPCVGLWLGHIDSDFILNQYGRPRRFSDGLYRVKKEPHPECTLYKMQFLRQEIYKILADRKAEVESSLVTSKGLFDEIKDSSID